MNIDFKQRELKSETLEVSNFLFCYLLAIRNKHNSIWTQFLELVKRVEEHENEM